MLRNSIVILAACLFIAAFIIFLYFVVNPQPETPQQQAVIELPQERPLTKEEFQAQEESQLRELLPDDIVDSEEEIDLEVQRLQELLSQ